MRVGKNVYSSRILHIIWATFQKQKKLKMWLFFVVISEETIFRQGQSPRVLPNLRNFFGTKLKTKTVNFDKVSILFPGFARDTDHLFSSK